MSIVLPSVLNYSESLSSLPENSRKTQIVVNPSNQQATYAPSNMIIFDLPNQGYLNPDSLYIRFKMNITGGTVNSNGYTYALIGTPVYSPFQRLEIIINSNVCETISGYNQIMNMMTNCKMSVAQKYGVSASYGFYNGEVIGISPTLEFMDGRLGIAASDSVSMAAPLPCILSNSKKLIPLGMMGNVRIQLTLDSLNNIFSNGKDGSTTYPLASAYNISNIELCYDQLEFNSTVDDIVRKQEKIYLKSNSFQNNQQTFVKSSGQNTMTFNTRLASIKSAFVNLSSVESSINTNKLFDSCDISKSGGEYYLSIGGVNYPQRPYNTKNSKNAIFQALRDTVGVIYDNQNSMSISRNEWSYHDDVQSLVQCPAKFYLGFNLERMHTTALLTGISSTQTAINFIMNLETVPTNNVNVNLILNFDILLEIDLVNRQCSVKQ